LSKATFHHEALLYRGDEEFVSGTVAFVRSALDAGAPVVLAILDERKGDLLREALGIDADKLALTDMHVVGRNPARLIPAWRDFAERHQDDDGGVWGIGEPIWAGRTDAEMVECHLHERLLNLAFADVPQMRLLCPYDADNLAPEVLDQAACNHAALVQDGETLMSDWIDLDEIVDPLRDPLAEPAPIARGSAFGSDSSYVARRFVAEAAEAAGFDEEPVQDLMVAMNELITNSIRHGGGGGVLHVWADDDALVCQVRDAGRIEGRLLGSELPAPEREGGGGLGLWLVNQICDLVQVRALDDGTIVRVRMNRVRVPAESPNPFAGPV
jgi:anti-sigma regulatory factor (Ser/Thr protein kinase)